MIEGYTKDWDRALTASKHALISCMAKNDSKGVLVMVKLIKRAMDDIEQMVEDSARLDEIKKRK